MTSILKTDEIQSQNGSSAIDVANGTLKHPNSSGNNLVLGSDGTTTLSGALTASGGIANAGTISAGTLGSSVVGGNMAVGTVSESSGTPTGDIIQKGSNANGEYVRYADGTQICWITSIMSNSSSDVNWAFPISFKANSLNNIFGIVNDSDRMVSLCQNFSTSTASVNFRAWGMRDNNYTFRSGANCMLCVIGRWY